MSFLKNCLCIAALNGAFTLIDASQQSPQLTFVCDRTLTPEQDACLRQQLVELVRSDKELGLNIIQPGMSLGVNKPWVDWLNMCVETKRREKFVQEEAPRIFPDKGKHAAKYLEARKQFAQIDEFVFFDLPPAIRLAPLPEEKPYKIISFSTPPASVLTHVPSNSPELKLDLFIFRQTALLFAAQQEAQEYQRRCDSIAQPARYTNTSTRERSFTTGDLTNRPL